MKTSPDDSLGLPPAITPGSTLVDPLPAFSLVTLHDVAHVHLSSHDDESGSSTTKSGPPSSSQPIFHFDEDIMEALTHLDFPWNDMHHSSHMTNMLWKLKTLFLMRSIDL